MPYTFAKEEKRRKASILTKNAVNPSRCGEGDDPRLPK